MHDRRKPRNVLGKRRSPRHALDSSFNEEIYNNQVNLFCQNLVHAFSFRYELLCFRKLLLVIDNDDDNYAPTRIIVMGGVMGYLTKLNEVNVDMYVCLVVLTA